MQATIVLKEESSPEDARIILEGIKNFNQQGYGASELKPLVLALQTDGGETVGGLTGHAFYGWLYITLLFVPQELRGQDYGTRLLTEAEAWAGRQQLTGVWLDTYTFQAPAFYSKCGFEPFGSLPDFPAGHNRVFYRKLLK